MSKNRDRKYSVKDKVKYSRDWLRSTGQVTGPVPFARGVVTDVKDLREDAQMVTVQWDDKSGLGEMRVLNCNLHLIGTPESA